MMQFALPNIHYFILIGVITIVTVIAFWLLIRAFGNAFNW